MSLIISTISHAVAVVRAMQASDVEREATQQKTERVSAGSVSCLESFKAIVATLQPLTV